MSIRNHRVITISTKSKGGIRTVIENYYENKLLDECKGDKWIRSHEGSGKLRNMLIFTFSLFVVLTTIFSGKYIYHIHMAMKGSFFRKYIILKLLKLFGRKTIIHLHGSEFKVFYENSSKLVRKRIKSLFSKTDVVIVLSDSWKSFIDEIDKNINVHVVNNYVNPIVDLNIERDVNKTNIGFFGALGKRKGIYDLLDVVSNLDGEVDNFTLYVCGDGEIDKVKEIVNARLLSDKVKVMGWITGDEKQYLLNKVDAIVLPSYNEGLPMIILEGMSLGKIILSTKVGGIPEAIENNVNGYLIEPGNQDALKKILKEKLIPIKDKKIGVKAKEDFNSKYSPEVIMPKLKAIYKYIEALYA